MKYIGGHTEHPIVTVASVEILHGATQENNLTLCLYLYTYIHMLNIICNMQIHMHQYRVLHDAHLGCMYRDRVSQF